MGFPKSLREDHWERIKGSLPGKADDVGRSIKRRLSPEAAPVRPIHIAPWYSLPCVYGRGLVSTNGFDGGRVPAGSFKTFSNSNISWNLPDQAYFQ